MQTRGIIYNRKTDLTNVTTCYLSISDPDGSQEFEAYVISSNKTEHTITISAEDLVSGSLDQNIYLSLQKVFYLKLDSELIKVGEANHEFLGKIYKQLTQKYASAHFKSVHLPKQQEDFIPGVSRVTYAGRVFDEKEIHNLVDSSLEFWLTTGRYADRFEREFGKYLNVKNTLLVNSGSSANLIAFNTITSPTLKERQFKKGDEVITVAAGFPTTIVPAIQFGAVPVFLDITFPTYNIDVSRLEEALSEKTKAIMVAHTLGNPFDLQTVKDFCLKHNLWLIEDNCDALGSKYLYNQEWKYTGTIGDIGTSSFYPPHHMTMGEGGAVYMQSSQLKKIAESIRDWGRDCWCASGKDDTCGKRFKWELGELPAGYDHKYIYSHFGYNLKVTDMQAAIGCAQLEKIAAFVEARKTNWKILRDGLDSLSDIFILPEPTLNSDPSWFGFLLTIRDSAKVSREQLVSFLEKNKIQTRMLFAGNFLRHPAFNQMRNDKNAYRVIGELTNTDKVMTDTFWIGVYPGMKQEMLSYMIDSIHKCVKK
ncbi:lipopolysaccharide biosynthesis protein RfbH [Leptospira ognonensis]|uniref:Lipopolysaccharide biosynthesis protein RfbH n=1 Tax=Leptospira ognonensis TaxID=2484945 RepID=A0A4R9JXE8_9LEPT|nr:lipopolysaccharide biosynthesis protein RfbH [Leptospira ognonensis]TGL57197.1 lipopolysaccharide biosynthesis protein RfbH [Leptospira ognonensis]